MKRDVSFVLVVWYLSDEQDSYADPHGRTRYTRDETAYSGREEAAARKVLRDVRRTGFFGGRRCSRAILTRRTETRLGEYDADASKRRRKKR